jgi:hypothetical protein
MPLVLPRCGGSGLVRPIPGSDLFDALGCYPIFCCADWRALRDDRAVLAARGIVSLALVADPFGDHDPELLAATFDRVVRFKDHFAADLDRDPEEFVSRSRRKIVRRALRRVEVRRAERPAAHADRFIELYDVLCRRHAIEGFRRFSPEALVRQLEVPGTLMFEGLADGETVVMDVWYEQGDVAHAHLVAQDDLGYATQAAYATKWHLLEHLRGRVRWANFGGGVGGEADASSLALFKRGWTTDAFPAHLCTAVFAPEAYARLCAARNVGETSYFPAYREGEFQ